jgi:hypothetical protein
MSDTLKNKSASADERPSGQPQTPARRLFIFRASALLSTAAAAAFAPSRQAGAQTDRDPTDRISSGKGGPNSSDNDPSDAPGRGRGQSAGGSPGQSDRDPSDPPARGRGQSGGPEPVGRPSGPTDSDPSDPAGKGKNQKQ